MVSSYLTKADQALFACVNNAHHPYLDQFFNCTTNTLFGLPIYLLLYFFIKRNIGWKGIALFCFTIVLSDQCSATLLKPFFQRYRPCYEAHIQQVHLVGMYQGVYGFPSSHASNTFAFALLFWRLFKDRYRYSFLSFSWATIVSYGRIYEGVHYPLDCIGGALLGMGIGLWMHQIHVSFCTPAVQDQT